jgi:hypothetical protein
MVLLIFDFCLQSAKELPADFLEPPLTSRSQDNAEFGIAAHHAGVAFRGFSQRVLLNYGSHAYSLEHVEAIVSALAEHP